MIRFRDVLYGKVEIPEFLEPFLRLPEFVRLRGVRLSNVDSYEFKDFGGPSRWEHSIAVAHLAMKCAASRRLDQKTSVQLVLAALLHDVATPPFAHTFEYVLADFDHEVETAAVLAARESKNSQTALPIFADELPRLGIECRHLSARLGISIDAGEIAKMVIGEGDLGFLIAGTLDLDNADNVVRACHFLGEDVDRELPLRLAHWLASQSGPVRVTETDNGDVGMWQEYKRRLYSAFFYASEQELGRQAFLQYLLRAALRNGLLRRTAIWNTDDGLLNYIAHWGTETSNEWLTALVRRYRLLAPLCNVLTIEIGDERLFRTLSKPQAVAWIEQQLSTPEMPVFVMALSSRGAVAASNSLLPPPAGALHAFKLGQYWSFEQLPDWLRVLLGHRRSRHLRQLTTEITTSKLSEWSRSLPWFSVDEATRTKRQANWMEVLNSVVDWGFRLSRNENYHSYPSTFVHAIPSALITALGLRGELVLDPFGGTGQTAVEAVRYGGSAITSDTNSVATLVARARLTYLPDRQLEFLKCLTAAQIRSSPPLEPPEFPLEMKWHHPYTRSELTSINGFIRSIEDEGLQVFLLAAFSAILPNTTGRRGLQHGFFADNTPLPKGTVIPSYVDAIRLFIERLRNNVSLLERFYASMERLDIRPESALKNATVLQIDAMRASPGDYGLGAGSVPLILTSPPYLCMADYVLGNRLSYYWLFPDRLHTDFALELAARRRRFNAARALAEYKDGIARFAASSRNLLRDGGVLAMVVGVPLAKAFADADLLAYIDGQMRLAGLSLIWSRDRTVSWHRNHGYARLKSERVSVYVAA